MIQVRGLAVLVASLVLAACGQNDNDPGPGGVTVGEAKALDEAAEMLDKSEPQLRAAPDAPTQPTGAAEPAEPSS